MLTNPTIEHVTVVTEADWLSPVLSIGGVLLTAVVTWLISNRSLKASEKRAAADQERHDAEIARLNSESSKAEDRHTQQIEAMLKQGRREREVRFLRELSDYVLAFSEEVRDREFDSEGPEVIRLRQYSLKVHADFSEDDDAFAYNVSYFLDDLAKRSEEYRPISNPGGYWPHTKEIRAVADDAEKGAFYLLRWLHPGLSSDISQAFERYRRHGQFESPADGT